MLLYENAWDSSYEEIRSWYPVWYRDVFEMDAIWKAFGAKYDLVQADMIRMVDNNFIDFADAQTITRLENFLGIVHPFPRTLVERRTILRGFIVGQGHIGRQAIIEILSLFTSGIIEVGFLRPGTITITVTRDFGDMFNLWDINFVIGNRIPAHLSLNITDLPQPVRVVNNNHFIFRDLKMDFRISNITSPRIRLNGEKLLDGSWLLGAGIIHGIRFIDFNVKSRVKNYAPPKDRVFLDGKQTLNGTWALGGRLGAIKGISLHRARMGVYRLNNSNSMSGTLTRSWPWHLDGQYSLGGENNLEKISVQEVL